MSTADEIDRRAAIEFVHSYLGSDESDGLDVYDKCFRAFLEGAKHARRHEEAARLYKEHEADVARGEPWGFPTPLGE